jgi:hypothetical protein
MVGPKTREVLDSMRKASGFAPCGPLQLCDSMPSGFGHMSNREIETADVRLSSLFKARFKCKIGIRVRHYWFRFSIQPGWSYRSMCP